MLVQFTKNSQQVTSAGNFKKLSYKKEEEKKPQLSKVDFDMFLQNKLAGEMVSVVDCLLSQ